MYTLYTRVSMTAEDRVYCLIKLLLYTAKEENAEVTPTKLQKIFFLLEKEKGVQLGLDFEPFIFGPYSKKLSDYLDKLIELEEVEEIEKEEVRDLLSDAVIGYVRNYVLNVEFKPEEHEKEVEIFFREWVRKSKDEIMNYVYKKYHEYFGFPKAKKTY